MKTINDLLPFKGREGFKNPPKVVFSSGQDSEEPFVSPDPYVMEYNGEYYCFSTGYTGVSVIHSTDLISWDYLGYAIQTKDERNFWAPSVIYDNGLFYMYYSSTPEDSTDPHDERMKVAVAKSPAGPYFYKKTLFDTFSIDAHVVRGEDGEFYLFYSTNEYVGIDRVRPGTVILVDRLVDMFTPEGKPQIVVEPTLDEEIFEENRFGDGRDWHTIEGALYLKRRGTHYCMFSGNAFTRPTYFIGYSIGSSRDDSISLTQMDWMKYPNEYTYDPLLKKNNFVEGVGHNSVAKAPNGIDDWVIYHGRRIKQTEEEQNDYQEKRHMRLDPIIWMDDRMFVPGPSFEDQFPPAKPTFYDFFDRKINGSLGTGWRTLSGEWTVSDKQALQGSFKGIGQATIALDVDHYHFEANMKWKPYHLGGRYGVYACYQDEINYVKVLFDVGKRQILAYAVQNGVKGQETTVDLEDDFDFSTYHKLTVIKAGELLRIFVDDLHRFNVMYTFATTNVGLCTLYTSATFAGIKLTRYFSLDEETQDQLYTCLELPTKHAQETESHWELIGSGIGCRQSEEQQILILDDAFHQKSYRFQVDFQIINQSIDGELGLFPYYVNDNKYISVSISKDKKIMIEDCTEKEMKQTVLELPEIIDVHKKHTFYIRKVDDHLLMLLNEHIIFDENVGSNAAKVGLFTSIPCKFDSLEWLQLD